MTELTQRTRTMRPPPDEAVLAPGPAGNRRTSGVLRVVGALAIMVVGAVHLEQYFAVHYDVVPVIAPLFVLNFVGAMGIGLVLLVPAARLRTLQALAALGGIALAGTSFVFLFVSEHQPLFGFEEYGYRTAIVVALAAEAVAVLSLAGYLAARGRT
jgi:hypothetical protein